MFVQTYPGSRNISSDIGGGAENHPKSQILLRLYIFFLYIVSLEETKAPYVKIEFKCMIFELFQDIYSGLCQRSSATVVGQRWRPLAQCN